MDWFLFQFFMNIVAVSFAFAIFYQQQPQFACYFLIWVALFVTWNIAYSVWKLRFDKAVAQADSTVGGVYSDAVSNISVVKSFAMETANRRASIRLRIPCTGRKKSPGY